MTSKADTIANSNKNSLSATDRTDDLLISRVNDCIRFASEKNCKKFIGFLDEREKTVVNRVSTEGRCNVYFYGGYDDATRVCCGYFPLNETFDEYLFPLSAVTLISRDSSSLTHRDYLGSVMSLGIERDCIGDILCEKGRCVMFVRDTVVRYIIDSLQKVGGEGVKCHEGYSAPLPIAHSFLEISKTVSSMRIDSVVAAVCNLSRTRACEKISLGLVSVNGFECKKQTKLVSFGDKLVIRGIGKFIIDESSGKTRKDRIILNARKYI